MMIRFLVVAILELVLMVSGARGEPMTVIIEPIADTWLEEASPDLSHGSARGVSVDGRDPRGKKTQALMLFDLGQVPTGSTLEAAILTLTTRNGGSGAKLYRMLQDWSESATWNSFGSGVRAVGVTAVATSDLSTGWMKPGRKSLNVADAVKAWVGGEPNHGWVFLPRGDNGWDFDSREGPSPPQLKITYQPSTAQHPGVWISRREIAQLPITGDPTCDPSCEAAWNDLVDASETVALAPDISDPDEFSGAYCLAKAYVSARTVDQQRRAEARSILEAVVGTEKPNVGPDPDNARSLDIGQKLPGYVLCADVIDLHGYDPIFEQNTFIPWIHSLLTRINADRRSLATCQQERPNNWGTYCGAARAAAALYLMENAGDPTISARVERHFEDTITVFEGWLGDSTVYADFSYGGPAQDLSWQYDTHQPVGINPSGSLKDGRNVDGVIPDDQRRCGSFTWPPCFTDYPYLTMTGGHFTAEILFRKGYDAWNWSDQALLRAVEWMWYDEDGKQRWDTCNQKTARLVLDITDRAYDTEFIQSMSCYEPKSVSWKRHNVAWTSWTHQIARERVSIMQR